MYKMLFEQYSRHLSSLCSFSITHIDANDEVISIELVQNLKAHFHYYFPITYKFTTSSIQTARFYYNIITVIISPAFGISYSEGLYLYFGRSYVRNKILYFFYKDL